MSTPPVGIEAEVAAATGAPFDGFLQRLGQNIQEARKKTGLKQMDVHSRTGLTYRHYQNIEAGRVNVTVETLHRLAGLFRCRIQDLVRE